MPREMPLFFFCVFVVFRMDVLLTSSFFWIGQHDRNGSRNLPSISVSALNANGYCARDFSATINNVDTTARRRVGIITAPQQRKFRACGV